MKILFIRPLFQRQKSICKSHTSEILASHPYLEKADCPSPTPPPPVSELVPLGRAGGGKDEKKEEFVYESTYSQTITVVNKYTTHVAVQN